MQRGPSAPESGYRPRFVRERMLQSKKLTTTSSDGYLKVDMYGSDGDDDGGGGWTNEEEGYDVDNALCCRIVAA